VISKLPAANVEDPRTGQILHLRAGKDWRSGIKATRHKDNRETRSERHETLHFG